MSPLTLQQALELAIEQHGAGRLAEAEGIYRQVLGQQPDHPDALHLLGVLAHQVGRDEIAVELIRRALAVNPAAAVFHRSLGDALSARGELDAAIGAYRRALELKPADADAGHNLAIALKDRGRVGEAIAAYRAVLQLRPDFAAAHYNLGNALLQQGQRDEAIDAYRRAVRLRPDLADAHHNLGTALSGQGRREEAVAAYRRALELQPDGADTWISLGQARQDQGQPDEAIAAYQRAIQLRPDAAEAHNNLGNALTSRGRLDEAIAAYRRALQLRPDYAVAHNNLANARMDVGQLDEALAEFRRALQLKPDYVEAHSNLIFALHFHPAHDAVSVEEEHRRWHRQFAEPLQKFLRPHAADRDPDRRLRLGYVSPNFSHHVICHFLTPLLEAHDPARFEIYAYASVRHPDEITERLSKTAAVWREARGVRDEALAEQIREDRIDILVDLTQHMADSRLLVFARQPAPVQVAWLGYPGRTGLRAMDYRLTDALLEPEGAESSESGEEPVRLPDSWFCFAPIDAYPQPGELPALRAGHVTFGCLNNFCKVNDDVLRLWADVLRAVPGARLLLQCPAGGHRAGVREFFAARGIGADRVQLVPRTSTREEFLDLFQRIDIALDPLPYNGGTTTCEALWMGIPVLTLPGSRIVSRIGLSILSAVGLPEWVAASEAGFVSLAASLAGDLPHLAELRSTLRARMKASRFMDAARFTRNVEAAYREMWARWCAAEPRAPQPS